MVVEFGSSLSQSLKSDQKSGVAVDRSTQRLLHPEHLYTASEVLARPCPVPISPGVYAWYFDASLPLIDAKGCHRIDGRTLLYVGISPKAPPLNGRAPSRSNLKKPIRTHYCGNAEGSTLRRTLGCLLSSQLGIQLRRVGSGGRYTFTNPGEQTLDRWMDRHAFVTWVETAAPWNVEESLLASGLSLPLNLRGNISQTTVTVVTAARLKARCLADELPIVSDNGGARTRVKTGNKST
jgi:hypothetical protein